MAAAKATQQSKADKQDNELILYRLAAVEAAVKEVGIKVEGNIKRTDLIELRDTIVGRITEIRADLQKQIDDKADKATVDDIRTLIKSVSAIFGSIIAGLIIYYITNRR